MKSVGMNPNEQVEIIIFHRLSTDTGTGRCAQDTVDTEGGGEGGGGGDGGGGDPVEQELALPVQAQLLGGPNTLRQLRRLDI